MVEGSPNILSDLVFLLWIPFALYGMKRREAAWATAALALAAVMFLPEQRFFKVPGLPQFSKLEIGIFWIAVGAFLFHRVRIRTVRFTRAQKVFAGFLTLGVICTIMLNRDELVFGPTAITGHRPYDAVHYIIFNLLNVILPFALGAAMFRSPRDLRTLLRVIVMAALIYSIFQWIELRLSPQINRWVYGYHQHDFIQTMRSGGFRPMVFMSHGLAVAMLTAVGLLAAAVRYRARLDARPVRALAAVAYLGLLLVLSKSTAAFLYCLAAVPVILFFKPKMQARFAVLLAVVVIAYPIARDVGLVPVEFIKQTVLEQMGEARFESVETRFDNEDELLERANQRITFGWGSYCRACIYDDWDGRLLSVRDGDWIILLGDWGMVGLVGKFGLLLLPIFVVWRRLRFVPRLSDRRAFAGLAIIVGLMSVDLLPNGNFNYLPLLYSGALFGCLQGALQEAVLLKRRAAGGQTPGHG